MLSTLKRGIPSKSIVAEAYSNAKSGAAKKFLNKIINEMPFNIKYVQVDGESEFMREFEDECKNLTYRCMSYLLRGLNIMEELKGEIESLKKNFITTLRCTQTPWELSETS